MLKKQDAQRGVLVKEALENYLDDLEDICHPDKVVRRIRKGREDVISSEKWQRSLL
ncbi:hypothetical protein [Parasutterella excrementihominis]|uniref:hypothetical protein n=1 Tax=Parasutterella excrementihominis TaxID=487175 RepID=UPI00266FD94A|nr:hypothetical protein [Parasutterella excrementihominis]